MNKLYRADIGPFNAPVRIDISSVDWDGGLLIRSTNWLGDAVMTLPAVYRLSQLLPDAVPTLVLCPRKLESFWQFVPWVDEVLSFEGPRLSDAEIERLRAIDPGLSVVLPNSFGAAWDVWRAGVRNRLGRKGRWRTAMLDFTLPEYRRRAGRDRFHQARHYLEFPACLGSEFWNTDFPPLLEAPQREKIGQLLPAHDGEILVIAPGAAYGPAKQWPVQKFNQIARWWADRAGQVVSTGAPGEEEAATAAVADVPNAVNLAGKTTLTELVYVLAEARCVLANDSGTMHLAAALHRDGVAVFGSTDPVATGPVGGRWLVHRLELPCSPCLKRRCKREDFPYECLHRIDVSAVQKSIEWLLAHEREESAS